MSFYQTLQEYNPNFIQLESSGINRYDKVHVIANTKPLSLKESDTIESAVYKIIQSGHRSIPVISRKHHLLGIITTSDILNAFLKNQNFHNKVNSIMTREVIFLQNDDPIGLALQKMKISRRGRLPIVKKKKLVGIVSEYDIIKYFAHHELHVKVSDVMTRKPLFITHTMSLFDVLRVLANTKYRRLPVVENGKVIGIITVSDVLKYLRNSDFNISELFHPADSLLRKKVFSIDKDKDLSEAIRKMLVHSVSGLVVLGDGESLEGIITERDIINQIV